MSTIRISICGEILDLSYEIVHNYEIIEQRLVGDTYFIKSNGFTFSCYSKFWEQYIRDRKIKNILK